MENEIQPQKKKWYKKWWAITLLIILAIIIIASFGNSKNENGLKEGFEQGKERAEVIENKNPNQNDQVEQKNSEKIEVAETKPVDIVTEEESKSLRSKIIDGFPEFKFTKGTAINNEDNYTGKAEENSIMQIIGSENSISSISFTSTMDPRSVSMMDKQSEYFNRLLNILIPGTKSYELIGLNNTGDKITKGDYEISYTYTELGGGTYMETHTFE